MESNIWYEFEVLRDFVPVCPENSSKVELVKTVIEDEVEELRKKSFTKKSLRTSALFSL